MRKHALAGQNTQQMNSNEHVENYIKMDLYQPQPNQISFESELKNIWVFKMLTGQCFGLYLLFIWQKAKCGKNRDLKTKQEWKENIN